MDRLGELTIKHMRECEANGNFELSRKLHKLYLDHLRISERLEIQRVELKYIDKRVGMLKLLK